MARRPGNRVPPNRVERAPERRSPTGIDRRRRSKPRTAVCSHGTQARERRPPVGTAARRAAAAWTPTVGMAPFSARTPEDRVARRPGNRVPPNRVERAPERRSPTGIDRREAVETAYRRARRIAGTAWNADLRSAPPRAAGRTAHSCSRKSARTAWNADLRPVSRCGPARVGDRGGRGKSRSRQAPLLQVSEPAGQLLPQFSELRLKLFSANRLYRFLINLLVLIRFLEFAALPVQ